jgi:hypothetical protein
MEKGMSMAQWFPAADGAFKALDTRNDGDAAE